MAAPNPDDILRLGPQVASIKAGMPKKRWAAFVKLAHSRGHTIRGELSDGPDALKERTSSSLREQARKSVSDAYAPAQKVLTNREKAIGYLDEKRKADDASYRTWLTGETEKLSAQAKAADTTLATQQATIATETKTAIEAARADSLARMAGGVSDPAQSAALDTTAADAASTSRIAAAREHTAAITKIGDDSRTLASASVLAQQAAREASRQGDTWKAIAGVAAERDKLGADMAAATVDRTEALLENNVRTAQTNREADLAAASLGLKEKDLAASITEAERKFKIETAKFGLSKWKAEHADTVAQAKLDLGYDEIASREGIASARRKLDEKLTRLREKGKIKDKEKKGVTQKERDLYQGIEHVRGLFTRWDKNNAVPLNDRERHLLDMGYDTETIAIARDLARNSGILSDSMRARARKLGVSHSGYFWPPPSSEAQPSGDAGR